MKYRFLIAGILQLAVISVFAQNTERIEIRNANSFEINEKIAKGVRRFLGDVIFEHNDAIMYCDSAYYFPKENMMHAYSNVQMNRGDTLHMYGDFLLYNGNTSVGKVRHNVRLVDEQATLTTDSLDFNTRTNVAYYSNGGRIVSETDSLESSIGYYYANDKMFIYKDSVRIKTEEYLVLTDTLHYNTADEIAYFFGPTEIFNEENYLYCEHGWYKTNERKFQFNKNAKYTNKEHILKADSLFYDDSLGIGRARMNVEIIDTTQDMLLKGNFAHYVKEPEYFFLTDSAVMVQVSEGDDSLYMHADTLMSHYDTSDTYRILKAFYKVKIYKSDLQGKCDSLVYTFNDSIIRLYNEPVIWSGESQMTANLVAIHTENQEMEHFELQGKAFIISKEDSVHYNQIFGKKMLGFFIDGELRRMEVYGNGQSIYYTTEEGDVVGMNKAESSDIFIYLKDGQVSKISMIKKPDGILYPLDEVKAEESLLKGFKWWEMYRPKSYRDIFVWEN